MALALLVATSPQVQAQEPGTTDAGRFNVSPQLSSFFISDAALFGGGVGFSYKLLPALELPAASAGLLVGPNGLWGMAVVGANARVFGPVFAGLSASLVIPDPASARAFPVIRVGVGDWDSGLRVQVERFVAGGNDNLWALTFQLPALTLLP